MKILDVVADSTVRYWKANVIFNVACWLSEGIIRDLFDILALLPFPVRKAVYVFLMNL